MEISRHFSILHSKLCASQSSNTTFCYLKYSYCGRFNLPHLVQVVNHVTFSYVIDDLSFQSNTPKSFNSIVS